MNTEILIIEDDPVIRKELQTVLEGNKYHTSVIEDFSDVTEQVQWFSCQDTNLIFL